MVLILGISGLMVGITMTCLKFSGEIIADGSFSDDPAIVLFFLFIVGFDSLFLVFSINLCMKYYDQIDVMPTYFAQILIWSVFCGLILLDEIKYYTTGRAIAIVFCSLVAFVGIQILAKKSNIEAPSDKAVSAHHENRVSVDSAGSNEEPAGLSIFNTSELDADLIDVLRNLYESTEN